MFSFIRISVLFLLFISHGFLGLAASLDDSFSFSISPLEILRINNQVVDPLIIDAYPEGVTVPYILENLQPTEGEGTDLSQIRVLDLSNTVMSVTDFADFWEAIKDKLTTLQVLKLRTVSLRDHHWASFLFPLLEKDTFSFLDVVGAHYENGAIRKVLDWGKEYYTDRWGPLSEKIIFSTAKYSNDLNTRVQWVSDYMATGKLSCNWKKKHDHYYQKVWKEIEKVPSYHFLTSSDDEEGDLEGEASFDSDDIGAGLDALTLDKDA